VHGTFRAGPTRRGHDLFSSEKPEAVEEAQEERKRKMLKKASA
jgi:hypothetical protein